MAHPQSYARSIEYTIVSYPRPIEYTIVSYPRPIEYTMSSYPRYPYSDPTATLEYMESTKMQLLMKYPHTDPPE